MEYSLGLETDLLRRVLETSQFFSSRESWSRLGLDMQRLVYITEKGAVYRRCRRIKQ